MAGSAASNLIRGSVWMIASRWAMRLIGLVSTVILARLLAPDDFGVIAIALIVVGLLETIAYAGVDLALMRPGNDSREHYDTAWTIQLIQGGLIAAVLLAIAPFAAPFFSEPRATAVLQIIALRPFLTGFQNIGIVAFRKELDFAKDFRFTLYTKLLNFFIVIGAAFWFRNYWALVIGLTTSSLIDVSLSYLMHPYRPRLCLAKSREIWGFSQWLIVSRVGMFLNRKTDEFVVGRLLGTQAMGGYHVANELSTMPNAELVMPLRRAMFPTISKVADQPAEFERLMTLCFAAIAALGISVGTGLMAVAPELVPIVLGNQWLAAIDAMRWLALYSASSALILTLEMALWVTGKTRLSAAQTWLELALLVPAAYLAASRFGIEGAAAARLGVSLAILPLMLLFVSRACSIRLWSFYSALWRPVAAGAVMAVALGELAAAMAAPAALILASKIVAGMLIFPGTMLLFWALAGRPPGIESEFVRTLRDRLTRRRQV